MVLICKGIPAVCMAVLLDSFIRSASDLPALEQKAPSYGGASVVRGHIFLTDAPARVCNPASAHAQATLSLSRRPTPPSTSNMTRKDYTSAVDQVKEHIQAGDIFQLVLSHRFKRRTFADPFEIYRHAVKF